MRRAAKFEGTSALTRTRLRWIGITLSLAIAVLPTGCKKKETSTAQGASRPRPKISVGPPLTARITLEIDESAGLSGPRGVAVDRDGSLWVVDTGNNRLVQFDARGKELVHFGEKGSGPGQFLQARMVRLSPQGELFVLDSEDGWIQVFTPSGTYSRRVGGPDLGFYHPAGFAIGGDRTLFVADTGGNRILPIDRDGKAGDPITAVGGESLSQPTDVCLDARGGLYVYQTATGPETSSVLYLLTEAGRLEQEWAAPDSPSTLDTAVASDGRVCLTDPANGKIRVYDAHGAVYRLLEGADLPKFQNLSGIDVDAQGRLYVADAGANAVYRLELSR